MKPERVRLFVKSGCGWCQEAEEWLKSQGIEYETINVSRDPSAFAEMRELSGQTRAPVIDVDDNVFADFGADELAEWWRQFGS